MKPLDTILHVEDDPSIQAVARVALETVGGFNVTGCDDGQHALNVLATFRPDLILMDVMMPNMDGPTTLKHLQQDEVLASIPVVFMTARIQPAEVEQYRSLGAVDVLEKPFDPMTLAERLRAVWENVHGDT
ncbi:response regulator [Larsenimonas rhizosphaerae]|uniref:Response regulator n=1 Tax=Larsenimonas rhizosphaerae TaxID=2944682 RepID=A0AA41ZFW3_9GAMM|nr:response regulator [Larsenimonas rhizosphaerae]MCX2524552.1 response regulator [Larsenimonas rhizosphaerae]